MPTSSSFTARVLALGKITIPEPTRDLLKIKQGDLVEVVVTRPIQEGDKL
jgi:bifunctional DNA-binding transcriptional regulator/antitoxin component of YhaV-PrlF toxin-antitoxin module